MENVKIMVTISNEVMYKGVLAFDGIIRTEVLYSGTF